MILFDSVVGGHQPRALNTKEKNTINEKAGV